MAVDIWILEVRDVTRAVRGLTTTFGLTNAQSEAIARSLPYCVKRNIREQDAPRYQEKLKAIGATVSWGPAGERTPPAPRVEVAPNDAPEEPVDVPEIAAAFDARKGRLYWGLLGCGVVGLLVVALASPGLSSGEAHWGHVVAGGLALASIAGGVFGTVLTGYFRLPLGSPVLPAFLGAMGAGACAFILLMSEPDPQERLSHVATLRAEVLAGQASEARSFLDGGGVLETADAARSRAFVESLYSAGARRVLAIDEDHNREAEWLAIDMPVLPARRGAISGAYRSYAGANMSEVPAELATPSRARHWIVPVDIH